MCLSSYFIKTRVRVNLPHVDESGNSKNYKNALPWRVYRRIEGKKNGSQKGRSYPENTHRTLYMRNVFLFPSAKFYIFVFEKFFVMR